MQAKHHIMSLVSSQFSEAGTDRLVCACNSSIYLVQHFMATSGSCLAFVSCINPQISIPLLFFLLKLVKQVPGYVGIGAYGCETQIYQLLWHYCMQGLALSKVEALDIPGIHHYHSLSLCYAMQQYYHLVFLYCQIVKDPKEFDVMVMPNLYGDILR